MAQPSAQYSLILRVEIDHQPGMLGRVATAIGEAGGQIGTIELVSSDEQHVLRDITVDARDDHHWQAIVEAVGALPFARVVATTDRTFLLHVGGKIEQRNKMPLRDRDDLSRAYTPGVARVCTSIAEDRERAFQFTIKRNTVAVVSDGTAVLGLGDIGPEAAMPVMEGKCMLFKEFAGVDGFPLCLSTKDVDEIVETVVRVAPTFGGINLEDISAPRCFAIEERLKERLDIPVFHDDQHGTAIVVLAAVLNALKITGKRLPDLRVLVVGLGAAGIAVTEILRSAGVEHVVGCDSRGAVSTERADYLDGSMNPVKRRYAETSNPERLAGGPADVIDGMDLFIGLSGARIMEPSALSRMSDDAMVFAMANPNPEVSPEEAAPYARIVATGRSDYPNQINNVLAFPGVFRGALDVRASAISEGMKIAAAHAIAACVPEAQLSEELIIPSAFDREVAPAVAAAVARTAREEGLAGVGDEELGYAPADVARISAPRQRVGD